MADMEEVQPVTIVQQADDIADGEEKTVREFEEPQVQNDQLENQNDKPAVSAINRQPVGSGKKWVTGEMVTDSKEVFFEQIQLAPAVRDKVNSMIDSGAIELPRMEGFVFIRLKNLNEQNALTVLEGFEMIHNTGKIDKPSHYLANIVAAYQTAQDQIDKGNPAPTEAVFHVPPLEPIQEMKKRLNMDLEISTGQRKIGPPLDFTGKPAKQECFLGSVSREAMEVELIALLETVQSPVHDLRLMMGYDGKSRGFAFCTFIEEDGCKKCKEKLDGYEFMGKKMVVNISTPATRLFVGSIPKDKTKEEFETEFRRIGVDNFVEIIMHEPAEHLKQPNQVNRGFLFIEFPSHMEACEFRKQMAVNRTLMPFGKIMPNIDWAEPVIVPDEAEVAKVKNVYVVGWSETRTEEQIQELFMPFGTVEKVKKIGNYSFVHYAERDQALAAIEQMNGKEISPGETITCTIAKPSENNRNQNRRGRGNKNQYGWNPWGSGPGNGHWGGNNRFSNGNGFGGGGGYGYGGGRGGGRGGGGGYWGGPRPKRGRY